jgi:hypothetical protein
MTFGNSGPSSSMHLIEQQLATLQPVLRSRNKARQLLGQFWSDKIALLWTTEEIHRAANESRTVLTEAEARTVLNDLHAHYNPQLGLQWRDVVESVKQSDLGRNIGKRELHQFIHKDKVAKRKR